MIKLDGNDACVMMHTALRKCCDSSPTSAAYNLVHMICSMNIEPHSADPWRVFGVLVAEKLNQEPKSVENATRFAVHNFESRFFGYDEKPMPKLPDGVRSAYYALYSTFECFSQHDWAAMGAYLED